MTAPVNGLPAHIAGVRSFSASRRPGFSECAPSGRLRLDAIACWLQDVAYADVADAGLDEVAVWVVRRTRIRVERFPRLGDSYELTTFPSGLGRRWAERRTDIWLAGGEPLVRALSLWVHLDPESWHPTPLTAAELETYGGDGLPTGVSAKLRHAAPHGAQERSDWSFRATECDVAGHINNAAYWQPLEEELLARDGDEPDAIDVELEYRTPAQPGPKRVLADGDRRWITGPDGELHASFQLG